ncbi:MAG TPA: PEPxxWA-CTERM sorting domain-containing protein [Phenylobacterium sp.]|nr:PEPxxWA-CTERM sorting domain-containing protein [Phenylobacterium sp.]
MRIRNTLFAAAAMMALASAASAAPVVSLSNVGDPNTLPAGQQLVADFNDAGNPEATLVSGFSLALAGATVGVNEGGSGYSGTLPNDPTHYLTVPGGASATLSSIRALKSFSLYMGSPDTYNSIRFIGDNGYDFTLTGAQISDGYVGQSWNWGTRINFDFGGYNVKQVVLNSGSNSFEVDNFAAAAVPEPATWALMISGFGGAGAMLRRRRTASTFA